MSGFFFCGMMLDPVEYASSSVMNELLGRPEDDLLGNRETSTPAIAQTNANSATKSRAAVPSIEFSTARSKPSRRQRRRSSQ